MLTILGIGTGELSSLTMGGYARITDAKNVILQTGEIPIARELRECGVSFKTLDVFYEQAQDFDDWERKVCAFIANEEDPLLCLVGDVFSSALLPGLMRMGKADILPGVGFFGNALSLCAGQMKAASVFACAASEFIATDFSGGSAVVITEVDSDCLAADIAEKLGRYYPAGTLLYVVDGNIVEKVPLQALSKRNIWTYSVSIVLDAADFLTKESYGFSDLCHIIAVLRGENGCPWDRKQTHQSLRASMIEESYEAVDAIDKNDPYMLEDELGDVLLQVVMHAAIAEEHSEFDIVNVCDAICKKMIRRHPHIFGEGKANTAEEVIANWEEIKRGEKSLKTYRQSLLDIPAGTSPLLRAEKLQKKASAIGFDWEDYMGALEKTKEELEELEQEIKISGRIEEEAGDLLFAMVNLLRMVGVDGEVALNRACAKFISRLSYMEDAARAAGRDLAKMRLAEQEQLWQASKREKLD